MRDAAMRAAADAKALAQAGFDAIIIENFGDAPFYKDEVPAITIAAMTTCALETREVAPRLPLGINVLRNDARAALAVAAASGASFVRVNVLSGARVTDQGIVEGRAAEVLRERAAIARDVRIFADVDVKHSAPLAIRSAMLEEEVAELAHRALADAILVTGSATGSPADEGDLDRVRSALATSDRLRRSTHLPVFVASGATERTVKALLTKCDGVIVGTAIKRGRRAGGPVDPKLARSFVRALKSGR
jgi:hypothetical protein